LKRKKTDGPNLATREKNKLETIYILEKHELPNQKMKLMSDKTIAQNDFKKKYGQLLYLENLRKSDYGKRGGQNPEPCPICQNSLGQSWSVLQCGHCYCVECMHILIKEYSSVGTRCWVRCPTCRATTYHAEISYVNTT
jgi:E3 ubiquitin-protein ligase SHPRH